MWLVGVPVKMDLSGYFYILDHHENQVKKVLDIFNSFGIDPIQLPFLFSNCVNV